MSQHTEVIQQTSQTLSDFMLDRKDSNPKIERVNVALWSLQTLMQATQRHVKAKQKETQKPTENKEETVTLFNDEPTEEEVFRVCRELKNQLESDFSGVSGELSPASDWLDLLRPVVLKFLAEIEQLLNPLPAESGQKDKETATKQQK